VYNVYIESEKRIIMAAAYTKEFLVEAFVSRYEFTFKNEEEKQAFKYKFGDKFYDTVGRDAFRKWASLDVAAIKEYKACLKLKGV
jgi:hypothetical protein